MPDQHPRPGVPIMSILKVAAVAAALAGGFAASAQAQPYGYWNGGYGYAQPHYRAAPPVYVPPHIARKQAQLQERFVEKFGYVQPRYNPYGYRGHEPRGYGHHRPHGYGSYGYNHHAW
jgi:hypothetical protein